MRLVAAGKGNLDAVACVRVARRCATLVPLSAFEASTCMPCVAAIAGCAKKFVAILVGEHAFTTGIDGEYQRRNAIYDAGEALLRLLGELLGLLPRLHQLAA